MPETNILRGGRACARPLTRQPLGGLGGARLLFALVAIPLGAASCRNHCQAWRTDQADVIQIRGEYTIVVPRSTFMESTFGSDWASQTLFFGSNRGDSSTGERAALVSSPLKPLPKGDPVFIFSGTDWPDLVCSVYSLERKRFVSLSINLQAHTLSSDQPTTPLHGAPLLLPNGKLGFQ